MNKLLRNPSENAYCLAVFTVLFIFAIIPQTTKAQNEITPPAEHSEHQEEYSESALRRFEIITLSSFPFAAVHSYLTVRGVKMIRENKISPVLYPKDYRRIGIGAVSLALIIGVWDWLNTRNKDRTASRVPTRPPTPPPEEPDGSIASLQRQIAIGSQLSEPVDKMPLVTSISYLESNSAVNYDDKRSWFLTIPILQVRF